MNDFLTFDSDIIFVVRPQHSPAFSEHLFIPLKLLDLIPCQFTVNPPWAAQVAAGWLSRLQDSSVGCIRRELQGQNTLQKCTNLLISELLIPINTQELEHMN